MRSYAAARTMEGLLIPMGALTAGVIVFGLFCAVLGSNPFGVFYSIYRAAFSDWYSWQNTLTRAAPLLLCALCTALPARAGLIIIGNEGAMVIGAVGAVSAGLLAPDASHVPSLLLMAGAGMICGGLWICIAAALHYYRGVNSVISSLLLNYIAIALLNHLIEGPMRDPSSLNNPGTRPIADVQHLGLIPGSRIHDGLLFGVLACLFAWFLLSRTTFGFAAKVAGGNVRAAQLGGLGIGRILLILSFLGGACAGLAGMVEVAAVQGRANASVNAGYGYVGILVAFLARQNPAGVVIISLLLGGMMASGGMLQRAHNLPDAAVLVLQGILFLFILWSETLYGRWAERSLRAG
ncbi:MAG: ABC transporter permease [Acidobacteria bacterium]|nr:ABC transporter permease [Acidobacteriota bacterium]